MNIGDTARASGVSAKMIRYYEEIGLLPRADRRPNGYRHYGEADAHTLRFIRRARDLGFSIDQITGLLALWQDRDRASAQVKALAVGHVAALERKIAALQDMARTLKALADQCDGDGRPACPIIDDLAATGGAATADRPSARDRRGGPAEPFSSSRPGQRVASP